MSAINSVPSFTSLASVVEPSTLVAAMLGVGAVLIVPRLVRMGTDWIKASVGGGYVAQDGLTFRNDYERDDWNDYLDRAAEFDDDDRASSGFGPVYKGSDGLWHSYDEEEGNEGLTLRRELLEEGFDPDGEDHDIYRDLLRERGVL